MASTVQCPVSSLWTVPDHWSLEEAATVPLAYATAYYTLIIKGDLKKGDTVFIHSGASAVGQAAITVALSYDCEVFTLTKNREETSLLQTIFPQLKDRNICCSDDLAFEKYIRSETKGKGVDVVLNTLGGKALKASRRLMAKQGCFVDIGFNTDSQTQLAFYTREQTDYRFQLDALAESQGPDWTRLFGLVQEGMQSGVVKPLKRVVYGMDKIVEAFKNVEAEREAGKVLIKIRDEEKKKVCPPTLTNFSAIHRTCFDQRKSYISVGGLGGMGMEIAYWMVLRGARKIILTSRSGVTTGYQARKIAYLKQLGADIEVMPISINSKKTAECVFERAKKMGPIGGVFNIATILRDDNFLDQTPETFVEPLEAKITTTMLLDDLTRQQSVRDSLDHFVMFSSVIVSHGLMGQTNYAWGNTTMERICEARKRDGLPAMVPQWAGIADVGILAPKGKKTIISGKYPQRFYNVLNIFDFMMSQDNLIISSYVLVEKELDYSGGEGSMADQAANAIGKILGIKNMSSVDGDKEFIDLGVDSLISLEIKQYLERHVDLMLGTKDIQLMTFNSLKALVEGH
ncbi:fatty acid synthase [Plakobranchus ocellatus]|uniref:Fatty acid synthase n=1 Tax=Plakobranchus ocellatus TaxID=259542 RepID=A0AAV4AB87_9GAST|nr:fatty acid synthase [Plakobranchus ocellatus]